MKPTIKKRHLDQWDIVTSDCEAITVVYNSNIGYQAVYGENYITGELIGVYPTLLKAFKAVR